MDIVFTGEDTASNQGNLQVSGIFVIEIFKICRIFCDLFD
jgi:hypothetical protein